MKIHKKTTSIFDAPDPRPELAQKIINRIELREKRIFFAKLAGFGVCVAGSLALVGFVFTDVASELSTSGFFSLSSLIFSDFSSAVANFPDLIFSIMESIPAIPISLLFGGIVFFLWSVAGFTAELSIKTHTHQFSVTK